MGNFYRGVYINGIEIMYLLYADDVMLISPWDPENATLIVCIMLYFFMASGLRINFLKRKLFRVGFPAS